MATHGAAISSALYEHKDTFQQYIDLEEILLCLRNKEIVQNDEYQEMTEVTEEKKKKQTLFLLKKISTAGEKAFLALLDCLKEKHEDLAGALLMTLARKAKEYAEEVRISKFM